MSTTINLLLYTAVFGPMAAGILSYLLGRFQKTCAAGLPIW